MESNLQGIEKIFAKMEKDGWTTNGGLKWGFFFISQNKEMSMNIFNEMKDYNYNIEDLHQNDDGTWTLQVSKFEFLTPDKLNRRNISFNDLASRYEAVYDGWDVGKK